MFGNVIPLSIKQFLYSLSLFIKDVLIFLLPIIIFALVFNSVYKLGMKAIKFIFLIVPLICVSNFMNTLLSYVTSVSFLEKNFVSKIESIKMGILPLTATFTIHLPKIISNDVALLLGLVSGLLFSLIQNNASQKISTILEQCTKCFFKVLMPIVPLFIVGTALKLQHDEMLLTISTKYFPVLIIFVFSALSVVTLEYLILARFNLSKFFLYIKNIIPAIITGFGSMSSAAALPLSIKAAEQNLRHKENAGIAVPSIVNIHLVGDCFFIPMMAITIMISLGIEIPNLSIYTAFALHFILAKFAVAAVPGGGILVMIPILQKYLNFNAEMLGLITAIYVLFDPIITACNIAGNGAMAIIFDKITDILKIKKIQKKY
jgi:Na+/H+-dicarboxylate symporter